MADVKISALPASTTPLAGTEVLPIVQGSPATTVKVSVANLTAGRAISATQITSTVATGTAPFVVASTTEVANLKAATATTAAGLSATLAIGSGGTNQTAYTAPSGTVKGLIYYDGTSFANDTVVTDEGYDTTNNNLVSRGYALSANGIITESTTSRTLSAADNGKVIYCTNGSTTTITTATTLGAGFSCTIVQGGAGKVTVAQGASTTLVSYSSLFSTMGQYAVISLIAPVADTFIAAGNLGV